MFICDNVYNSEVNKKFTDVSAGIVFTLKD